MKSKIICHGTKKTKKHDSMAKGEPCETETTIAETKGTETTTTKN
jgi:hypothetical protein